MVNVNHSVYFVRQPAVASTLKMFIIRTFAADIA